MQRCITRTSYTRLNKNGVNFSPSTLLPYSDHFLKTMNGLMQHEQQNNNKEKWANNISMNTPSLCQCNEWRYTYGTHSIIPMAICIVHSVVRCSFIYLYFHYTLCSHAYTHTLSLGEPYQFIRMWLWQFIMVYNTPWWKNKRVAYVWKILCNKWVCCVDEIEKSIWYLF